MRQRRQRFKRFKRPTAFRWGLFYVYLCLVISPFAASLGDIKKPEKTNAPQSLGMSAPSLVVEPVQQLRALGSSPKRLNPTLAQNSLNLSTQNHLHSHERQLNDIVYLWGKNLLRWQQKYQLEGG